MKTSQEHLYLAPAQVRPFSMDGATPRDLALLGIGFDEDTVRQMMQSARLGFALDSAPVFVTAASAGAPMQFLQHILPAPVLVVTAARKIDALIGRTIAGSWADEEIVQPVVEYTGRARPYGDVSDTPYADFNVNYERRSLVRFEEGAPVGVLESRRDAAMKQNTNDAKRAASANALAIEQNRVGFYGYNNGDNRTYGFLNDPWLPNYGTLPARNGSTKWKDKDFDAIAGDLRLAAAGLRTASGDNINPNDEVCVLAIATSCMEYLSVTNLTGLSVRDWITKTYPKWRIESAPELDSANGGQNVFYLFAETMPGGTNGNGRQRVVDQYVPSTIHLVGVEKRAKGSLEVYSNATAGVMFKLPLAVLRFSGI